MPLQPGQKLTPIIVTEKKIISLKKPASSAGNSTTTMSTATNTTASTVRPTAKILPESKRQMTSSGGGSGAGDISHTAIIRPVIKPTTSSSIRLKTADEMIEDELLADSPVSSPTEKNPTSNAITDSAPARFTNRRVVLKSTTTTTTTSTSTIDSTSSSQKPQLALSKLDKSGDYLSGSTTQTKSKGIFDRLDRLNSASGGGVGGASNSGVDDTTKRKISRFIVRNEYSD